MSYCRPAQLVSIIELAESALRIRPDKTFHMPPSISSDNSAIKLLAVMEASTVTGPAKNLIEFCQRARTANDGLAAVNASVATFHRRVKTSDSARNSEQSAPNRFVAAL